MINKIVLFDIDKVIFDRNKYLGDFDDLLEKNFNLTDNELEDIVSLYDEVRDEIGYFSYARYLEEIYKFIPRLRGKLDYYFQQENIEKYLFTDSSELYEIKGYRLGILSKGELEFQERKIKKFNKILEKELIYIFQDKIKKIPEVLNSYKDTEIFIVDDRIDVLMAVKDAREEVKTVLMDRDNENDNLNGANFRISSLSDIIPILK